MKKLIKRIGAGLWEFVKFQFSDIKIPPGRICDDCHKRPAEVILSDTHMICTKCNIHLGW